MLLEKGTQTRKCRDKETAPALKEAQPRASLPELCGHTTLGHCVQVGAVVDTVGSPSSSPPIPLIASDVPGQAPASSFRRLELCQLHTEGLKCLGVYASTPAPEQPVTDDILCRSTKAQLPQGQTLRCDSHPRAFCRNTLRLGLCWKSHLCWASAPPLSCFRHSLPSSPGALH